MKRAWMIVAALGLGGAAWWLWPEDAQPEASAGQPAPEDIAKAEEKLRRIEVMRAKPLAKHPELAR